MVIDETTRAGLLRAQQKVMTKLSKLDVLLSPARAADLTRLTVASLTVARNWWIEQRESIAALLAGRTIGFTIDGEEF